MKRFLFEIYLAFRLEHRVSYREHRVSDHEHQPIE
jgi:hypothetical protein